MADVRTRTPLTGPREDARLARLRRWQVVPTIHKLSHKAAPQGDGAPVAGSREEATAG